MSTAAVVTGTSSYTHEVCGQCGRTLYCSEAEPWEPQSEYGWCWHLDDIDGGGGNPVTTMLSHGGYWHLCVARWVAL